MLRKLAIITLCASTLATAKQPVMVNGIVAGTIGYWAVKALGYGAIGGVIAGAGTVAVALAPASGPLAVAASSVMLPGAGLATTAASGVAAGIAGTASTVAVTNGLAMGAASVAASTGSVAGVAATIETSATTVGWFLTCIPWLP
jgi:hypothetical protein